MGKIWMTAGNVEKLQSETYAVQIMVHEQGRGKEGRDVAIIGFCKKYIKTPINGI